MKLGKIYYNLATRTKQIGVVDPKIQSSQYDHFAIFSVLRTHVFLTFCANTKSNGRMVCLQKIIGPTDIDVT